MGHDASVDDAGVGLDLCEKEQSALARRYVLTQTLDTSEPWSHAGPRSVSPFSPCASSRVPHILDAARLDKDSVLWDLGCGDGRVLHEAAARYGCRCVGVEIDAPCLAESARRAETMGPTVSELCTWHLRDATAMAPGSLGADGALAPGVPAPTVVLLFVTGYGLSALSPWLKREWETAAKPFAVVTCVEALDTCADLAGLDARAAAEGGNPLFDAVPNPHGWTVYRDATHAKHGVFVTPPRDVTTREWADAKPRPRPADPDAAARLDFAVAERVLDEADIAQVEALVERLDPEVFRRRRRRDGDGDDDDALAARLGAALLDADSDAARGDAAAKLWSEAEDACHAHRSHRVVHLHARAGDDEEDFFSKYAPRARAKLLRAAYDADVSRVDERETKEARGTDGKDADEGRGRLTRGRALFVRSAEYHAYETGGGVVDPSHRDTGSILTVSVALESPSLRAATAADEPERGASGGAFFVVGRGARGDEEKTTPATRRGDAVVFPSEKRHGVTPLVGVGSRRRSVVLELWEGGVTRKNRHE